MREQDFQEEEKSRTLTWTQLAGLNRLTEHVAKVRGYNISGSFQVSKYNFCNWGQGFSLTILTRWITSCMYKQTWSTCIVYDCIYDYVEKLPYWWIMNNSCYIFTVDFVVATADLLCNKTWRYNTWTFDLPKSHQ